MIITPFSAVRILSIIDKTGKVNDMLKKKLLSKQFSDMMLEIEAMNEGIIPYFDHATLSKSLLLLDEEVARKAKRKFRKLHRKLQKDIKTIHSSKNMEQLYGEKSKEPTAEQIARRKFLVMEYLQLRAIGRKPDKK